MIDDYPISDPNQTLKALCAGLREFVENINRTPDLALRGGIYQGIDKGAVQTVRWDGWVIGYKLEDHALHMRRKVFVKTPGYSIGEVAEAEREEIMSAICDAFVDPVSVPEIEQIASDCLLIVQDFIPVLLVEKNPNLVSISNMPSRN